MIIDPTKLSVKENYKLLTGSILPRPIAIVSTISEDGVCNIAPFSFFTGISSNPPTICFSPARKAKGTLKKDTLMNIEETREFVINMTTVPLLAAMSACATDYPPEVDEFEVSGFTPIPSERVAPPRIKESPINFECKLLQVVPVGRKEAGGSFLVIGEVVMFHIADDIIENYRINVEKLQPLARLAGPYYCGLGDLISA
ncbi:MAG: flavin reductase family protein [Calditrichaeota bacterium]|nr:MAG: flavin reductase family protein [Calditrichota bacterium]